jgi:hypothetical protein
MTFTFQPDIINEREVKKNCPFFKVTPQLFLHPRSFKSRTYSSFQNQFKQNLCSRKSWVQPRIWVLTLRKKGKVDNNEKEATYTQENSFDECLSLVNKSQKLFLFFIYIFWYLMQCQELLKSSFV